MGKGAIANLVEPDTYRRDVEEQRQLNSDRKRQNELVDAIDVQRSPDALESLPAKQLQKTVSLGYEKKYS